MTAPTGSAPALRYAFVGLGSNLGDRTKALADAREALADTPGVEEAILSPIYETDPVGPVAQPRFLNAVAALHLRREVTPETLLARLHAIERQAGRTRENEIRWGPRTLDLDLLLMEGENRTGGATDTGLSLPHPRLWERSFVTVPLANVLADATRFSGPDWDALRSRLAPLSAPVTAGRPVPVG